MFFIGTGSLRQVLSHGADLQIVQALAVCIRLLAVSNTYPNTQCHSFCHAKVYIASRDSGSDDKNPCIAVWSPVRLLGSSARHDSRIVL